MFLNMLFVLAFKSVFEERLAGLFSSKAFGNEVCDTVQEGREVELSRSKSVVGVMGLLKEVVVWLQ